MGTHLAYQSGTDYLRGFSSHNRLFNSFGYKATMYSKNEAESDGPE